MASPTQMQRLFAYRKKLKKQKLDAEIATKKANKKHPLKKLFNKPYKEFLKSKYWKGVRILVLIRDNYTCVCGSKKKLHVHHKTYDNHFDEHNHLEDLVTLCKVCHEKEHDIKK